MVLPPGTAPVKAEYLLPISVSAIPDDDAAEGSSRPPLNATSENQESRRSAKKDKKANRGANKGRRYTKIRDELDLCWRVANGTTCEFGDECRFNHDIQQYLSSKPRDLPRITSALSDVPPFVSSMQEQEPPTENQTSSINPNTTCPVFAEHGYCRYGFKCRFLGDHVQKDESGALSLTTDVDHQAQAAVAMAEMNFVPPETQKLLRSKKYQFPITDAYLKELQTQNGIQNAPPINVSANDAPPEDQLIEMRTGDTSSQLDTPDVPFKFREKKRLHWAGKTYLAPLTTVGNLPFRRLCVKYGADITCSEMGLANSFLSGSKEEWSLVRRHPSESVFGVQIAGNKPNNLVPTAEILGKECAENIDFVDVNCGCPIDLVFNTGSGSALLDSPGRLGKILIGMNRALGAIPVTVKLRTGVSQNTAAHKLMPRLFAEWGVGCISLHGRTRQQRYTKLADWDYIKRCVEAVRSREADEDLPPIPIFGGGDCYSAQGYWSCVESSGVDGVMIGRGALIKPWIFTEIKERREWDITSRERLDLIRQYAEYALCHFGTDTAGINSARRYLCEALSFQYRYVPLGLLETLPARLNDRPPAFRGRDELETLLASSDSRDWVRISEMFFGPAPPSWTFIPKHKSNSYESQG